MSNADLPSGGLSSSGLHSGLGLLRPLLALGGSALLLASLDRLRAGCGTSLWAHGAALLDHIERCTNDGTLGLDLLATAGLGLLLCEALTSRPRAYHAQRRADGREQSAYLRDTLPPLSPAKDGPSDAAWVLALEEERLGLSILEPEDLAVRADKELALIMPLACCPTHSPHISICIVFFSFSQALPAHLA